MILETGRAKGKKRGFKDHLGIFGPGILITVVGFIIAYQFIEPAPPQEDHDRHGRQIRCLLRFRPALSGNPGAGWDHP